MIILSKTDITTLNYRAQAFIEAIADIHK